MMARSESRDKMMAVVIKILIMPGPFFVLHLLLTSHCNYLGPFMCIASLIQTAVAIRNCFRKWMYNGILTVH